MSIETYGAGERLRVAARLSVPFGVEHRLVLLPVPSTRDGRCVSGTDIPLSDALEGASEDTYIFGYGLPSLFSFEARSCGASVVDLSLDEEYLERNADLTALGTVGYILTTSTRIPSELSIGVVGYGRIGTALVRYLLFFGARLRVFTSRPEVRRELGESGVDTGDYSSLDLRGIDILINTAPMDMSGFFPAGIASGMRVIELASGNNFEGVEGVEGLPSIPERYYPESAGRTYAAVIKKHFTGVGV